MSINDNMNVKGGPSVEVRKVDQAKVQFGSRAQAKDSPGDVVKKSMDKIANAPGPRDGACQAPLSGKQTPGAKVTSTGYPQSGG